MTRRISCVEVAMPNSISYSGTRDAGHTTDTRGRRSTVDDPPGGTHEHRDRRGPRDRTALSLPAHRAGRAGLAPLPRLARRHRGRVGERPVAARALREERAPAAGSAG